MSLYINPNDLDAAINEAYRFIGAATELKKDLENNGFGRSGKRNASVFRLSLELTNALAHMRRRK